MGFGSAAAMNAVIRNNRNMLSKRKRLKGTLSGKIIANKEVSNFDRPSKQDLLKIRQRLQKENHTRKMKLLVVFGTIAVTAITLMVYYL